MVASRSDFGIAAKVRSTATAYVAHVDGAGRVVATYQTPIYGTGAKKHHRPARVDTPQQPPR